MLELNLGGFYHFPGVTYFQGFSGGEYEADV